jgi:putative SOS response-associated peptidase YedK
MCGRYTLSKIQPEVQECIHFDQAQCELKPRYNIAPTQMAPVIAGRFPTVLKEMRWGLIPFWAKEEKSGYSMINARAESVREKPSYRHSFQRRRCLVPADSFYEWQKQPGSTRKQPMRILLQSEQPFAFAGLWDQWNSPDDRVIESYTIITSEPNDLIRPIHDRMPVILHAKDHERWLDPAYADTDVLARLFVPFPASEMKTHPVSTKVNNPKFDDPSCGEPANMLQGLQ